MQKQNLLLIISFALLVVLNFSCSTKAESTTNTGTPAAPPALPVDAVVARQTSLQSSEKLAGSIIANRSVDIMSELSRKIVSVNFRDGAYVRQGEVLYKLYDADLRAKHRQVIADLNLATLNKIPGH